MECYTCKQCILNDESLMIIHIPVIERYDKFWRVDNYEKYIYCSYECRKIDKKIFDKLNMSPGLWYYTTDKDLIQTYNMKVYYSGKWLSNMYEVTTEKRIGVLELCRMLSYSTIEKMGRTING